MPFGGLPTKCYHIAITEPKGKATAQILVRNLDKALVDRLKKRAQSDGRSLQMEVKAILERSAQVASMKEFRKSVDEFRNGLKGRKFPDSAKIIRKSRNH